MIYITSKARSYPTLPYEAMKDVVLGKKYQLSLSFIGSTRALALNKKHREGNYVPNVLSFPLADDAGEIYITPTVAKREAPKYGLSERGYIGYLFIHGLLHLKGYPHGATMEKAEKKYCAQFSLT